MAEKRGLEPPGSTGSAGSDAIGSSGIISSRNNSSSRIRKIFLACCVMLCIIQFGISAKYISTTTSVDEMYSQKFDIPTLQSHHKEEDASTTDALKRMEYYLNITAPQPLPTLVHFDPKFLGGFRNQHMRFVGFINFAVQNSIPQVLLPSLRWGAAQGALQGKPAPHEYLFDVVYWNERAEKEGLPRLVRYDASVLEGRRTMGSNNETTTTVACFNTSSNLYSGLNEQLLRDPNTNVRKVKIWEEIGNMDGYAHCRQLPKQQVDDDDAGGDENFTYLVAHGGSKGVGRLWADYNKMQRQRGKTKQTTTIDNRTITIHPEHLPVERAINTILRPSEAIRNAIRATIQSSTSTNQQQLQQQSTSLPKFLALHPRIEHDMMPHRCSQFMEQNLTKIFEHLRGALSHDVDLLFLAVAIELVMAEPPPMSSDKRQLALENAIMLNHTSTYGLFGNERSPGIPLFQAGYRTAENILFPEEQPTDFSNTGKIPRLVTAKSLGITHLVGSIVDFFTIIEAERFVGVRGSSFSTDLFSVRYYLGKGGNYILSHEGVEELIGPPPAHSCDG